MIAHLIWLLKTVLNFASGPWRVRFQWEVKVLLSSRNSCRRHIVILLVFDICAIICGWLLNCSGCMVVDGCWLVVPSFSNYAKRGEQLRQSNIGREVGGFYSRFTHKF